ncbi:hypothetical protein EDD37DRAFT_603861 [Exophiala viscosa]|uniref:NAD-dependent epimerase/dehydratase domain-containing protein n=1 Tax=Exophiala viscosa TaxID=2486360 RepID=A0AAN6DS21_9EURO|nr:hypothetical protein EDD36DRAFT_467335 [Exophiala viscosa]KAI1628949.1 hypothetical protein EDD37DRAFT_603861 [Exophiala viscosa]
MKIIVTGATGFVGHAVVRKCILSEAITSVIILSRNPVGKLLKRKKVRVIRHDDFLSYPPDLLETLRGAQCCIWCLGKKPRLWLNPLSVKKVNLEFPLAAANAFKSNIAPGGQRFQFVFCSMSGAEWDPLESFWETADIQAADIRKLKGAAERGLLDIAEEAPEAFRAIVLRPGFVKSDADNLSSMAIDGRPGVHVSVLASALLRVCIQQPMETIIENEEIVELGTV